MNKSFIILLTVGMFVTSVRSEEKKCNEQNTKEVVCELHELVKQQSQPSIGETDFSPVLAAISNLSDESAEGIKTLKKDINELRGAIKEDLEQKIDQQRGAIVKELVKVMLAILPTQPPPPPPKEYKSCHEIYADGQRANGAYELSLEDGKIPVYCHMADIQGCGSGGFTMVMKMDGNKGTFNYDDALWVNKKIHNSEGGSTGFDNQETKLPTYSQTPFTKLCLGMKVGGETKFISIDKAAASLYALIADNQYRATSLGRDAWKSLISGSSLQHNCNKEGFNAITGKKQMSKARIGITSNNENNCDSNDSRIGFGTAGYPDDNASCGDVARHGGDNGDKTIKAFGYILVQ